MQIVAQAQVGDIVDRRGGIRVDRHDVLTLAHSRKMMRGAGDTARNIKVGPHCLARLPHLPLWRRPAEIDR